MWQFMPKADVEAPLAISTPLRAPYRLGTANTQCTRSRGPEPNPILHDNVINSQWLHEVLRAVLRRLVKVIMSVKKIQAGTAKYTTVDITSQDKPTRTLPLVGLEST